MKWTFKKPFRIKAGLFHGHGWSWLQHQRKIKAKHKRQRWQRNRSSLLHPCSYYKEEGADFRQVCGVCRNSDAWYYHNTDIVSHNSPSLVSDWTLYTQWTSRQDDIPECPVPDVSLSIRAQTDNLGTFPPFICLAHGQRGARLEKKNETRTATWTLRKGLYKGAGQPRLQNKRCDAKYKRDFSVSSGVFSKVSGPLSVWLQARINEWMNEKQSIINSKDLRY